MNKKYILGLGTLAMIASPVAAIISCGKSKEKPEAKGDDKSGAKGKEKPEVKGDDKPGAKGDDKSGENAKGINWADEKAKLKDFTSKNTISSEAAVLAVGSTDVKTQFEAIKGYIAPEFSEGVEIKKVVVKTALTAKKVVYTITIGDGTKEETKDVTVTFAAAPVAVNGKITLNQNAKLGEAAITGSATPFAVTVPNGTDVTTDKVKALFTGKGEITVVDTDTYAKATAGSYTFTITAKGQNGGTDATAILEVKVEAAAPVAVNGKITLNQNAKLGEAAITGSATPFAVTVPNGTDVTTDKVKALFTGKGEITVVDTDTYAKATAGSYTFTITAKGQNGGTDATAILEVKVEAAAPVAVNGKITLNQNAKLGEAAITGSATPFAVTVPNGTDVTTDKVKALFTGKGEITVVDTDTYAKATAGSYTFTITAKGQNGGTDATAILEVKVEAAAPVAVNGKITLNQNAKLGEAAITGSATPFAVTVPNGTDVTTDKVKALFTGKGEITVVDTDTYAKATAGSYTFTITAKGQNGGTDATAILEVKVEAAAPVAVNGKITLNQNAKLGEAAITGSATPFAVTVPNGTDVTTDKVKALFTGKGEITVVDTDTYAKATAGSYTFTITAKGQNGGTDATATLEVKVEAAAPVAVNGKITLNQNAKLGEAAITGSATPFAVTVPNGTDVTTDKVKALFTGKGEITVVDTDTYAKATAGSYTFTITAKGQNGGTDATATLEVKVEAAAPVAVNGKITLNQNAKLGEAAITGSATPFAVTVPNGTDVTTDKVKALFTGKGEITVVDTDTYAKATAGSYTFTITAKGQNGGTDATATLEVKVEAAAPVAVNGKITLNQNAKLGEAAITGSATPFAVTVPNGTDVTTDKVKALFTGKGEITVVDTDTYAKATAGSYTFTITAKGQNGGTDATATLEVTVSKSVADEKSKAKGIIEEIVPNENSIFKSKDTNNLFEKITVLKTRATSAIDAASTIAEIKDMVSSPTEGSKIIEINQAIKKYKNFIYNLKSKIVAFNDDNSANLPPEEDNKSIFVINKFTEGSQKQIDLLKGISITGKKVYKIITDSVKDEHNSKDGAWDISQLKSNVVNENFENEKVIFVEIDSDTTDGQTTEGFNFKNHNNKNIQRQFKWVKNDNIWNLELTYVSPKNSNGEDDSINRYKVVESNQKERNTYEAAKFADFNSTDKDSSAAAILPAGSTDVKAKFIAIACYVQPATLSSEVSISKVIVKTPLTDKKVVYTLTLTDGTSNVDKDVTVTFAATVVLADEAAKFADFNSTDKDSSAAAILPAGSTDVKAKFIAIAGYVQPATLSSEVSISKVIVKTPLTDKKVVYTLTLTDGTSNVDKDVTVTFAASGLKKAHVTIGQIKGVIARPLGSENAYTLKYDSTKDEVPYVIVGEGLKKMVAKAAEDTGTPAFTGSWGNKRFDRMQNGTYTYTVSADGYEDVVFKVTVSGS